MEKIKTGHIIENYRLEKLIGSGGFTNVYKAINLSAYNSPNKIIAIKILHSRRKDRYNIKNFERSANISLPLRDKNIAEIYNYTKKDNNYFIFMELLDCNLETFLRNNKNLLLGQLLGIIKNSAEGLKYLHDNNIIHKDIKESNILVSNNLEKIKITDFGLAKSQNESFGYKIIKVLRRDVHKLSGTENYLSPEEKLLKRSIYDKKTDIFSFGKTIDYIFKKSGSNRPKEIENVIKEATEEDPKKRFQDMKSLIFSLEKAINEIKKLN